MKAIPAPHVLPRVFHRLYLILMGLIFVASVQAQGFSIERFHTKLDLKANGDLLVEETIDVAFSESKRGIFREIPFRYDLERGGERRVNLNAISVTDQQGTPLTTLVTWSRNDVNIRIGDEDIYFEAGAKRTYVIRYRARGMMNEQSGEGNWEPWIELYWNAFGSDWLTGIADARVDLTFPDVPEAGQIRLKVLPGYYGSTRSFSLDSPGKIQEEGIILALTRNSATIQTTRPLSQGEDITVALGLPQGTIAGPTADEKLRSLLTPWAGLLVPLILLGACAIIWAAAGRDPWAGKLQVAFDPPTDVSPAHFGGLIDESVDPRDFAAAIVGLAVKGYLRIHPMEKQGLFGRSTVTIEVLTPENPKPLTSFERAFYTTLTAAGPMVTESDMQATVSPKIPTYTTQIYNDLVSYGFFHQSPQNVRALAFGLAFFAAGGMMVLVLKLLPAVEIISIIIGGILSLFIIAGFGKLMPRATLKGANAKAHARGFAKFLREREHFMEWVAQKQAPEAAFEEYLPYAVALGLEASWIKSFEGILREPPSWYDSNDRSMIGFAHSFGWMSRNMATAAGTPPRSSGSSSASSGGSGFSGGGFSGGGFGGGGGGSW